MRLISGPTIVVWQAVAFAGRPVTMRELIERESVRLAAADLKRSLREVLSNLVAKGHLECDSARLTARLFWYGATSRAPDGEQPPRPVETPGSGCVVAGRQRTSEFSGHALGNLPLVLRPGATDHEAIPSRMGDLLVYRDGRKVRV